MSQESSLIQQNTRHLPYFKTLRIFNTSDDDRPTKMSEYLADWYQASRREPYYQSEQRINFVGYWSWEAAAITFLLGIDGTKYRDAPSYVKDLVDFARSTKLTYDDSTFFEHIVYPNDLINFARDIEAVAQDSGTNLHDLSYYPKDLLEFARRDPPRLEMA